MLKHHTDTSKHWDADSCCGCGVLLDMRRSDLELWSEAALRRGGAAGPWEPACLALFLDANPPAGAA